MILTCPPLDGRTLEGGRRGICRATADDIAFVLRRLKYLEKLFPIYQDALKHGGFSLKPRKCAVIPLVKPSRSLYDNIASWVLRHIPEWKQFNIVSHAKFLGFYIGPHAGQANWAGPISKFKSRVRAIQKSRAPIAINSVTFNARTVPVLSYQAPLLLPPVSLLPIERTALHTVLRLPQKCLCHANFSNYLSMGFPNSGPHIFLAWPLCTGPPTRPCRTGVSGTDSSPKSPN